MELIDKAAVIAKIDDLIGNLRYTEDDEALQIDILSEVEKFVNTLEVKEIDLEKIIEQTYHDRSVTDTSDMDHIAYENIASYFFELGLKAQKGE